MKARADMLTIIVFSVIAPTYKGSRGGRSDSRLVDFIISAQAQEQLLDDIDARARNSSQDNSSFKSERVKAGTSKHVVSAVESHFKLKNNTNTSNKKWKHLMKINSQSKIAELLGNDQLYVYSDDSGRVCADQWNDLDGIDLKSEVLLFPLKNYQTYDGSSFAKGGEEICFHDEGDNSRQPLFQFIKTHEGHVTSVKVYILDRTLWHGRDEIPILNPLSPGVRPDGTYLPRAPSQAKAPVPDQDPGLLGKLLACCSVSTPDPKKTDKQVIKAR